MFSSSWNAANAADELLFGTEKEVPVAELLDLLSISPGVDTTAEVSASQNGPFGGTADISGDGRLTCRAEGDDVILAAGAAPEASGTCWARVCTTVLLVRVCGTTDLDFSSRACLQGGGSVDPGCDQDAPVCTGGAGAHCVGCMEDDDCGIPSGSFGLGLGQTAHVTLGLLTELLGLDLGVPLSTVQVGANVNGPFSDRAVLNAGTSCEIAADGSVDLVASADAAGESTCYVQACVPLLGTCLVAPLDILVDGCLLGGECNPIDTCDLATNTCETCRDDRAEGYIDSGCTSDMPVCYGDACAECVTDVDCTGKLLTVALGPNRTTVLELSRIREVLRLSNLVTPSTVKVSATADGPFSDEALLTADGALSGCSVDANGNVFLAATGVEGEAVCHVQVCTTLVGNTVETCVTAPIEVDVDACVLDRSCDLNPACDEDRHCTEQCEDTAPAGGIDRGCDADEPACGVECVECLEDAECLPKRPLLDLDLSETGEVLLDDILAAIDVDANALIDSVQVGATINGPFADTTTLDIDGEVAQCSVDLDGNVEVVATSTVYGTTTCYVEVCAAVLESIGACAVLPIEVNVDPCAADGSCRDRVCDTFLAQCAECVDTGPGVDHGCDAAAPTCVNDPAGDHCEECGVDADCGANEICAGDKRCAPCADTTAGGIDQGCDDNLPACDTAPLSGTDPSCVECTIDADCASGLFCDEATRNCVECLADSDCDAGEICLADNTCAPCDDDTQGGIDDGCNLALPACDEAPTGGADPICVECTADVDCDSNICDEPNRRCEDCLDTADGNDVDLGCDAVDPMCVSGAGGNHCEECTTDGDCNDGVCNGQDDCTPCEDDTAGGMDHGCFSGDNACDESPPAGGEPRCVDCTVDADCATDICDEATRICQPCEDTAAGSGIDDGCNSAVPLCLTTNGQRNCEECASDADCRVGEFCNSGHECESCSDDTVGGVDRGCGADLPACDVAPADDGAPECVECTADADCDSGLCDEPSRTCVDCQDTDPEDGVDAGCDQETPICAGAGTGEERCVECVSDFDCPAGEECREATNSCVDPDGIVAVDDHFQVGFGLTLTVAVTSGVLQNDSVPPGATDVQARVVAATLPDAETEGTVMLAADGSLVFTPAQGFSGRVTFQYEAYASTGTPGVGTVIIDVQANAPPVGGDEIVSTPEDTPVLIVVLANDRDPDGHGLELDFVGEPLFGATVALEDHTVLYLPPHDFVGVDAFDYTVCDAYGACTEATVSVTVRPVNDAPNAADDFVEVGIGDVATIDVLANDGDPDGDALMIGAITIDASEGVAFESDGEVRFTTLLEEAGELTFTYEACDAGGLCTKASVVVVVGGEPSGLVIDAVDDLVETAESEPVTFDVLLNDVIVGEGDLTVGAWTKPFNGNVAVSANGEMTYRPAIGFSGEDAFSYTACFGRRCDVAFVRVTVVADVELNAEPIALDDFATTRIDVAVIVRPTANDIDPDGDALSVVTIGAPTFGRAVLREDGGIDYIPAAGFFGEDRFEVEIGDGNGGVDSSTVTVLVEAEINNLPFAQDDTFEILGIAIGLPAVESLFDALANDSDADGDVLVIDVIEQPAHGRARLGAEGHLAYAGEPGFVGLDYVVYRVSDGRGGFDTATVTVIIGAPNLPPVALDDLGSTLEDSSLTIDVIANDSDPEGDSLSVEVKIEPRHGRLDDNGDGTFDYTPDADFYGEDLFDYEACDAGGCSIATVAISVTPVNDAPIAHDDHGTMLAGVSLLVDVLANDTDVDDDALHIRSLMGVSGGVVAIEGGKVAVLSPAAFAGVIVFDYEACDAAELCSQANVTIDVSVGSTAPSANDDSGFTESGTDVSIDVLANDTDPEGDTLAIDSTTRPTRGSVRIVGSKIVYTPPELYVGLDSFQYIACDLGELCDQARVTVTVTVPAANLAPVAQDDAFTLRSGERHELDVLANDIDDDGDTLRVISVSEATLGNVTREDDKLVYTAAAGLTGVDVFEYTICDVWNVCDVATVTVNLSTIDYSKFELSGGPGCANGGDSTLFALGLGLIFIAALGMRRARRHD